MTFLLLLKMRLCMSVELARHSVISVQQNFRRQVATREDVNRFAIVSAGVPPRLSLAILQRRRETETRAARPLVGKPGTRAHSTLGDFDDFDDSPTPALMGRWERHYCLLVPAASGKEIGRLLPWVEGHGGWEGKGVNID